MSVRDTPQEPENGTPPAGTARAAEGGESGESRLERREQQQRSRIGVLIARGRYDDATAALGVCFPEQALPERIRAVLARGLPDRTEAFLTAFRRTVPTGFGIEAAALGLPHRPGLAELVLLIDADGEHRPGGTGPGATDGPTTPEALMRPVTDLAREHLIDLAIGRGTSTEQAPVGLASARARAVALGEPLLGGIKRATLVLWADRGNPMIEMLASAGRTIGDEILGPLSARSQEALTLRRTLRAYLAHSGRVSPTVRELGIHRNTLRHRLERIEALTRCSLASADDRAELWMALRLVTDADPRPEG